MVFPSHNPIRPNLVQRAARFARHPGRLPGRATHLREIGAADARPAEAATRSYTAPAGGEAEDLSLAYLRYIELHGHALYHPKGGCSIAVRRRGRSEVQTFGFWSRRAACGFELFWERYRLVYGHGDHGGRIAA